MIARSLGLLIFLLAAGALAQEERGGIVADISQKRIEIRYSFDGADLILFGAIQRDRLPDPDGAFDVAVELIGPERAITVRRKARTLGIWVNRDAIEFARAPGYYALVSTRPIDALLTRQQQQAVGIGLAQRPLGGPQSPNAEVFRTALVRHQARAGLYRIQDAAVDIRDRALFRTDLTLPANVPVGDYQARVFLVAQDRIIDSHETTLKVGKSGFERTVYDFANDQPLLYGLTAVLIALAAGWTAGVVVRN